jgi:hypothetical protein
VEVERLVKEICESDDRMAKLADLYHRFATKRDEDVASRDGIAASIAAKETLLQEERCSAGRITKVFN